MTSTDLKTSMLTRPKDFSYYGDLDLSVWGFSPIVCHRDSEHIDKSNFEVVLRELRQVSEESVEVIYTNHYLVGWFGHIMVLTTSDTTMTRLLELVNQIEEYPILDEDDVAQREYESASGAYDSWVRPDIARICEKIKLWSVLDEDGDYNPSDEQEDILRHIVADCILKYDATEGIYNESDLLEAIADNFSFDRTPKSN